MTYGYAVRKSTARFEVYESYGSYRWRLVAANGEKVAGGEAYTRRADAHRAVDTIKRLAPEATVEDK